jgi:metal-dependent hydrolase (beta-lactamase superfamily II)
MEGYGSTDQRPQRAVVPMEKKNGSVIVTGCIQRNVG